MRTLVTFLLLLFCVVTLTTPTALAARMASVSAPVETAAHCQTGADHAVLYLAKPAAPAKSATGDCADCTNCMICVCQCQSALAASHPPQAASHADSLPELALAARAGITAAPELKPPRK